MKSSVVFLMNLLPLSIAFTACQNTIQATEQPHTAVISENLRFCESTYPYQGGVLIANFGTEELNPLNTEGKGYIVYNKGEENKILIPADGNLSAPKGMFIKEQHLFICDVNKIVVYSLSNLKETPQTIHFPENDLFINDLAAEGNNLYASVTNSGKIYRIDISNLAKVGNVTPVEWVDVTGANGLIIDNGTMYIASYPADGKTTDDNVIYQITNLQTPAPQKFITQAGQYDGIALSADKKTMYISNWAPAGISSVNMETKQITPLIVGEVLAGPADITVANSTMYIPDLPNSKVIILPL